MRRRQVVWARQPDDHLGPVALYFTGRAEGHEHVVWPTGRTEGPLGLVFSAVVAAREDTLRRGLLEACPAPSEVPNWPMSYRDDLHDWAAFLLAKDWPHPPPKRPSNIVLPPGGLRAPWQRQMFSWPGAPVHILRRIQIGLGVVTAFDGRVWSRIRSRALQAERRLDNRYPGWHELEGDLTRDARDALRRVQAAHRFLWRSTRDVLYWYPRDLAAAAWVEIIHAKRTGGTAAPCNECKLYFLVPHGYRTIYCPLCARERRRAKNP
jgi:hypothetical protein